MSETRTGGKTADCLVDLHFRCEFCERREAAKDAEIAALRAENEKKANALRWILHRFRNASESLWYKEARLALEGDEP